MMMMIMTIIIIIIIIITRNEEEECILRMYMLGHFKREYTYKVIKYIVKWHYGIYFKQTNLHFTYHFSFIGQCNFGQIRFKTS